MRKVLSALLLTLFGAATHAQTALPPVYEITTDTAVTQQLNANYWQLLEDKSGKWTIDQVSQEPLSRHFYTRGTAQNGVDTVVNTYWIRYGLKNEMARDATISLEALAEREDFYVRAGIVVGNILLAVTGYRGKNGMVLNSTALYPLC